MAGTDTETGAVTGAETGEDEAKEAGTDAWTGPATGVRGVTDADVAGRLTDGLTGARRKAGGSSRGLGEVAWTPAGESPS